MTYFEAFIIGLMGSFHCLGMCGPMALALPLKDRHHGTRLISSLLYNFGRIITYGLMGVIFGLLGRGFYLGGFQQKISIAVGTVTVFAVIFPVLFEKVSLERMSGRLIGRIKGNFRNLFGQRTYRSLFTIGLLNGILPCGLVYIALAGAMTRHHTFHGTIFMVMFGLGTMPMMYLLPVVGNIISANIRRKINKFLPFFLLLIGLLFIVRGLNLGIPYLSPQFEKEHPIKPKCCQKDY